MSRCGRDGIDAAAALARAEASRAEDCPILRALGGEAIQ